MKPFISVIVPIYNVERYLAKCISSLLNQTYDNYELILVNDGSPDNCGAICDEFKQKSDKIIVLHLENGGVCNARNQGMDIAKGDFYCFVDSDDWVEPTYIEDFVTRVEDDYTVVIQDTYRDNDEHSERKFFGFEDESFVLSTDFAKMVKKNKFYFPGGYPWNKLFSAKIIKENQLRFDPAIRLGDDEKWNYEYFQFVKKFVFCSRPNYHYIYNPTSISNQARPFERELLRYQFRTKYFNFALENYDNKEEVKGIFIKEAEEFFRICIFDRIYKEKITRAERLERLKTIAALPKEDLYFLQSPIRMRNLDYILLKNGQVGMMDFFKTLRLKMNK